MKSAIFKIGTSNLLSSGLNFTMMVFVLNWGVDEGFDAYALFLMIFNLSFIHIFNVEIGARVKGVSTPFFIHPAMFVSLFVSLFVLEAFRASNTFLFSSCLFILSMFVWLRYEGVLRQRENFNAIFKSRIAGVIASSTFFVIVLLLNQASIINIVFARAFEYVVSTLFARFGLGVSLKGSSLTGAVSKDTEVAWLTFLAYVSTAVPGNIDKVIFNLKSNDLEKVALYNLLAISAFVFPGRVFDAYYATNFKKMVERKQTFKMGFSIFIKSYFLVLLTASAVYFSLSGGGFDPALFVVSVQSTVFFTGQFLILDYYSKSKRISFSYIFSLLLLIASVYGILWILDISDIYVYVVMSIIINLLIIFALKKKLETV